MPVGHRDRTTPGAVICDVERAGSEGSCPAATRHDVGIVIPKLERTNDRGALDDR
jgi:hypothetical protein